MAIRGYIVRKDNEHRFCIAKTGARKARKGLHPYDPGREARRPFPRWALEEKMPLPDAERRITTGRARKEVNYHEGKKHTDEYQGDKDRKRDYQAQG